jgi:hypothetical protein
MYWRAACSTAGGSSGDCAAAGTAIAARIVVRTEPMMLVTTRTTEPSGELILYIVQIHLREQA